MKLVVEVGMLMAHVVEFRMSSEETPFGHRPPLTMWLVVMVRAHQSVGCDVEAGEGVKSWMNVHVHAHVHAHVRVRVPHHDYRAHTRMHGDDDDGLVLLHCQTEYRRCRGHGGLGWLGLTRHTLDVEHTRRGN